MATPLSLLLLILSSCLAVANAGTIDFNFGRVADDLPSAASAVNLLKTNGIAAVKLYDADPTVLRALAGTHIKVIVNLPNENLTAAAADPDFALSWVQCNVAAYFPATQIQTVGVENEDFVDPDNLTSYLVPAMQNVHSALVKRKLDSAVKISSPIALSALQSSYPSSSASFKLDLIEGVMKLMLELLCQTGSYLIVNAYPFFAYEANAYVISLFHLGTARTKNEEKEFCE